MGTSAVKPAPSSAAKDSVVTPSDSSPADPAATVAAAPATFNNGGDICGAKQAHQEEPIICAACQGRMVVHSCGKREMPIDYEAIARAEQERKEREAAEKHRIRAEKRRVAEAKRREARRLKKAEEERQKLEEERQKLEEERRVRKLEAQRYEEAQVAFSSNPGGWTAQHSPHAQLPRERESPAPEYQRANAYTSSDTQYGSVQQYGEPGAQAQRSFFNEGSRRDSYESSHSWNASTQRTTPASINIDGTEVQTSAALHPTDALAALAGLADSLSQPVPTNNSHQSAGVHGSWKSNGGGGGGGSGGTVSQQPNSSHYQYHGSDQRRADIISHAFSNSANQDSNVQQQSGTVMNSVSASGVVRTITESGARSGEQKSQAYAAPACDNSSIGAATLQTPVSVRESASDTATSHTDYRTNTGGPMPAQQEPSQHDATSQPPAAGQVIPVQPVATTPVAIAIENVSTHPLSQPRMPCEVQPLSNAQEDAVSQPQVQQSSVATENENSEAAAPADVNGPESLSVGAQPQPQIFSVATETNNHAAELSVKDSQAVPVGTQQVQVQQNSQGVPPAPPQPPQRPVVVSQSEVSIARMMAGLPEASVSTIGKAEVPRPEAARDTQDQSELAPAPAPAAEAHP